MGSSVASSYLPALTPPQIEPEDPIQVGLYPHIAFHLTGTAFYRPFPPLEDLGAQRDWDTDAGSLDTVSIEGSSDRNVAVSVPDGEDDTDTRVFFWQTDMAARMRL